MIRFTSKKILLNIANTITPNALFLLKNISELKGKQSVYQNQHNEYLNKLQIDAIINNTLSSNYIDGLIIDNKSFIELFEELIEPSNDLQSEMIRYVKVLNTINSHYENIDVNPELFLQFHRNLFGYKENYGGYWRSNSEINDNYLLPVKRIEFDNIQTDIDNLCSSYQELISDPLLIDLVVISAFILDFMSMLPFDKGNGRMIRLISLLLLYKQNYNVVKYISIDQIIKENYSRYLYSLSTTIQDFQEDNENISLWIECFLWILNNAYLKLDNLISPLSNKKGAKTNQVKIIVDTMNNTFKISDIADKCPGISRPTINKVLQELRDQGEISPLSLGRDAVWQKKL